MVDGWYIVTFFWNSKNMSQKEFFFFSWLNHVILKVEFANLKLSTEHNLYLSVSRFSKVN